jgi:hypothetical protein
MTIHQYLRLIAGAFVLASLALGYYVDRRWFLFTAFVGLNLFQSAFSNWCPMITILKKLGIRECAHDNADRKARAAIGSNSA